MFCLRENDLQAIEVGEMSYSDIILTNQEKTRKDETEKTRQKYMTTDGHEINVGVNHLGHFLLVNLLLEHLQRSESSRYAYII